MKDKPDIEIQLIHIQGPLKGQIQEFLTDTVSIGRHTSCDVIFPREFSVISRRHARIEREGNRFKITDQSTNGTFVNGKQIEQAYLKDGDVIMFSDGGPKASFLAHILKDRLEEVSGDTTPMSYPQDVSTPAGQSAPTPPARDIIQETPEPPTPATPASPPSLQETPKTSDADSVPIEKVQAPLIVQYGPTLNSFKELPITIGTDPTSNLMLPHPAITKRHAQIFFARGQYWIKDLSGTNCISVNSRPAGFQVALNANDVLALSPTGPTFRFLGEGRLAEYEEIVPEEPDEAPIANHDMPRQEEDKVQKVIKSFKDMFKK
ncbi:MAG TPA: FHA domain-containing protein [Deltaproteobacteria bacterium]|nr:FHA domain-containing protein [Deltaproteobacteria bacterium]